MSKSPLMNRPFSPLSLSGQLGDGLTCGNQCLRFPNHRLHWAKEIRPAQSTSQRKRRRNSEGPKEMARAVKNDPGDRRSQHASVVSDTALQTRPTPRGVRPRQCLGTGQTVQALMPTDAPANINKATQSTGPTSTLAKRLKLAQMAPAIKNVFRTRVWVAPEAIQRSE